MADLEEYKGGRDFDALKKFADEKLKVRGENGPSSTCSTPLDVASSSPSL